MEICHHSLYMSTSQAMGWPDIWSEIILGVSVRVFLEEISICMGRPSKADCLHNVGGPYPISQRS
jgi:hypothetical protein